MHDAETGRRSSLERVKIPEQFTDCRLALGMTDEIAEAKKLEKAQNVAGQT